MAENDILKRPKGQCIPTTILRNNPGMFRDCWAEKDSTGNLVFVIRQIKFNTEGSEPVPKVIRLSQDEAWALVQAIQQHLPAD